MLHLRELHARAAAEPGFVEPDPRAAMAELAGLYPGALREIDELSIVLIRTRIDLLVAAEADETRIAPWMTAQSRFHVLARGALAVKRWLAGRRFTAEIDEGFEAAAAALAHAQDARLWRDSLAEIARPPRGRLMDLVFARLARELNVDVDAARAAVLPPRESLRRGGA